MSDDYFSQDERDWLMHHNNLIDFEIKVKTKIKTKYPFGICSENVRVEND